MKTYNVYKAQSVTKAPVKSVTLVIDKVFPEISVTGVHRHLLQKEGRQVAEALIQSLPQGVVDELLIALLEHTTSLLSVRHPKVAK